jgi:hypothetical protein
MLRESDHIPAQEDVKTADTAEMQSDIGIDRKLSDSGLEDRCYGCGDPVQHRTRGTAPDRLRPVIPLSQSSRSP